MRELHVRKGKRELHRRKGEEGTALMEGGRRNCK
jgi:hypothetical protein